jgi:hypothetical protein
LIIQQSDFASFWQLRLLMPDFLLDRNLYRPSGKVAWGQFLVREAGTIFVAAVGAVLAFFVYHYWLHLVVLMPLAAGVILGILSEMAVERGRCRNRWIAAAGGLAAACVFYFGVFYVELLWVGGWRAVTRVDLIPRVIALHAKADVILGHARGAPNHIVNEFFLAIEFLCVACPAVLIPLRSSRVYCEACNRWADSEGATVSFDAAEWIVAAMTREQLVDLPEFPTVDADIFDKKCPPCTRVTLEHCPNAAENGCPIYLSVRRYPRDARTGRIRLKRVEIDPLETLQLMSKMPGLRGGQVTSGNESPNVQAGDAVQTDSGS